MKRQRFAAMLGVLAAVHVCLGGDDLLPHDRSIAHFVDHYIGLALKEAGVQPADRRTTPRCSAG